LIPDLRQQFNREFTPDRYASMLGLIDRGCGAPVDFRVAETPIFLHRTLLDEMASAGAQLTRSLLNDPAYLAAAGRAIPSGYRVAGESAHPHFLTADFALVRTAAWRPAWLRSRLSHRSMAISTFSAPHTGISLSYLSRWAVFWAIWMKRATGT